MKLNRVVVTGMGAITPLGNSVPDFSRHLMLGTSGCTLISKFDTSQFRTKIACELKGYTPEEFFDKKELKKLDAFAQYALISVDEAIKDAALLAYPALNKNKVGVLYTSGFGGVHTFEQELLAYHYHQKNPRYFSPFFVPRTLLDLAGGVISIKYGFKGMNFSVVAACASSTIALINAMNYIRLGKADVLIVGGSEASITEVAIGAFSAMKALSERNDDPATASRPFDLYRDGFVMGEGAGCMVLESLEHAQRRGAKIYAELAGGSMNADAYHITAPNPDGESVVQVMQEALDDAGQKLSAVEYINVHGTSTPLGDIAEINAIRKLFGAHAQKLHISATKSMTGHLMGAAGIVEAIASVLTIQENTIPPTINHSTIDPAMDTSLNYTFNSAQHRKVDVVLSNNFGFGGHNAAVVFKRYIE
ncbi:MAG TPA: beta-ketoacyl-ACP synthase II [Chitinophagales bacterium]|nr:beta-ketoacyl-ACP synthase II [Chitinophagales bacterium]HNM32591.1 beta-ketoacyl-ACP synthase II [Chitinophagales bacterium]